MSSRLESIAKIMLATGSINYLASAINSVNEEMKSLPDEKWYHKQGIEDRTFLLDTAVENLNTVMENLADYMNGADCISPIDVRATAEAFEIVSGRNDNVEE